MNQSERRLYLIGELLKEREEYASIQIPVSSSQQKQLLRALMNVRMPSAISKEFLNVQDAYLQQEIQERGIVDEKDIPALEDGICIWQGDITGLKCDAIVNAANSGMTGCYVPNHKCIDNCIHSFAGIQLRLECEKLMQEQGYEEAVGKAKITNAYNLPCRYVIHTVGPVIYRMVTVHDEKLLASCYESCLELADENNLESIAFCCISTGEFHFPNRRAAQIATETVKNYKKKNTHIKKVIFNVFKDEDLEIYEQLLGKNGKAAPGTGRM